MALAMKDMVKGTIVDHTHVYNEDDRREELRPIRRRGIIYKVVGDATSGGVSEVWVMFKGKPEKVAPRELVRVYPHTHPVARKAWRRLTGTHEEVGAEFEERRAPVKPRLQDDLGLTPRRRLAVVDPGDDSDDEGEVPIVIPDTEEAPKE
jgi:hypothetical protein